MGRIKKSMADVRAKQKELSPEELSQKAKAFISSSQNEEGGRGNLRKGLRSKVQWKQLKEKFSDKELIKFEEDYVALMGQFGEDVLPSEEIQILQIIELGILMDRIMIEKQTTREHVERLEKMQKKFLDKYHGDYTLIDEKDRTFIIDLETQVGALRSSEQNRTNEYTRLQEKHANLMKDLKGTRDQRIKQIESGGKLSFIGLIKALTNKDFQEQEGRQLELFKMAAEKEKQKLTDYHTYLDGEVDKPILIPDEE